MEAALAGGIRLVQLRERDLPIRELLNLARQMRTLTSQYRAKLLINDRIDICLAVEADGIHLRSNRLPAPVVRKILGSHKLIGVSTHSLEEAWQAEAEGADFIVLGPIYETRSKLAFGAPLGLETLRAAGKFIKIPLLALGGIQRQQVRKVMGAGADGIALISAILMSENPRQATLDLISELGEPGSSH